MNRLIRRRRRPARGEEQGAPAPPAADAAPRPGGARATLDEADRLVREAQVVEAVDLLTEANRRSRNATLEVRLVDLRLAAAEGHERHGGRTPWPPPYPDPFPDVVGTVPEVAREGLTTEVAGGAVAHHGALIVRNLFSDDQVARSIATIDRAHEVHAEIADGGPSPDTQTFRPLKVGPPVKTRVLRSMVAEQGGIWLADSPAGTATALEALHDVGAVRMMTEHFGERPFFSLQKSTLRRSQPDHRMVAWHQDGSFLDEDVRTMNIWVALTPCGGDLPTPALEVMPRRTEEILPVDGVMSPHSIDYDLVATLAEEMPTVVPEFGPGDALIFDEHFLHRTHLPLEMTHARYALECWFFAPSHHSRTYVPLLV